VRVVAGHTPRARERGFVLVTVLMGATLLVALGSSGLILSRTDLQITSNFLTGTQTLYVAEAGINHAWGVLDEGGYFEKIYAQGELVLLDGIGFGAGKYTVTAAALGDGTDPKTMRLTSVAQGPANARRTIEALLQSSEGEVKMVSWRESY
jgi:hypothetical protein